MPSAGAVACLALAGLALAVAGRDLSGPSPEERARKAEDRAAAEVESLAEAAVRLADSWAEERSRREAERASLLDSAAESSMALALGLAQDERPESIEAALAREAEAAQLGVAEPALGDTDLAKLLPEGVAVAIVGADGSTLAEAGGVVDFDSPATLVRAGPGGTTVAAAWADALPDRRTAVAESLARTLAPVLGAAGTPGSDPGRTEGAAGTSYARTARLLSEPPGPPGKPAAGGLGGARRGLYFVSPDGELPPGRGVALEIAARPVPAAPLARPLGDAGARPVARGTGDMETGRLVGARRYSKGLGWTAVAEAFLSPRELTAGGRGVAGALALTTLGLLAAGVFAHAVRARLWRDEAAAARAVVAGAVGRARRSGTRLGTRRAERARTPSASDRQSAAIEVESVPAPRGGSILRLREALGTPADGPDLAASARSPILRALSRCVRAPRRVELPREVAEWGAAAEGGEG